MTEHKSTTERAAEAVQRYFTSAFIDSPEQALEDIFEEVIKAAERDAIERTIKCVLRTKSHSPEIIAAELQRILLAGGKQP